MNEGTQEYRLDCRNFVGRSLAAGVLIGVACYVSLVVQRLIPGGVGVVASAFIFAFGIYSILSTGALLFTSEVGRTSRVRDRFACFLVFILNALGAICFAESLGWLVGADDCLSFIGQAAPIAEGKLNPQESLGMIGNLVPRGWASWSCDCLQSFLSALPCGALVYVAGTIYRKTGRFLETALPIVVFVLCGFRHCVVDAFYLAPHYVAPELIWVMFGNAYGADLARMFLTKRKIDEEE